MKVSPWAGFFLKPKKNNNSIPFHAILIINLSNRSVAWIGLVSAVEL